MNKKIKGIIIGGGPAGLICSHFFPEFKVVDKNPLGQLNLPFIPGPRLIQLTDNSLDLVKSNFKSSTLMIKEAVIGYKMDGAYYDNAPKGFKNEYTKITRKKDNAEGSYLSEGKKNIPHIEIGNNGEKSYKLLLERILENVKYKKNLTSAIISGVDSRNKTVEYEDNKEQYDVLINTIPLKIFLNFSNETKEKIESKHKLDFSTTSKCFYQCDNSNDKKNDYNYIYSVDDTYTRKTFYKNYNVYETVESIADDNIEGNKVLNKIENVPLQIKNSLCIENVGDIHFVGRYSEWNHKIKMNETIDRAIKLRKQISG